jgi:HK97 gp10 family phage protein
MSSFHLDRQGVHALLRGAQGDVARDLLRRGARVETAAKINATGREYGDGSRGPRVRTGRLRSSITYQLGQDSQGLFVDIGTNVVYGRYLELGTDRMRPYPFLGPALPAGLT